MLNIESLLTGTKADGTVARYLSHWQRYLAFAGSEETALTPDALLRWRQTMIETTALAANTINQRMKAVKTIIQELARHRLIAQELAYAIRDVPVLKQNMLRERRRKNYRVRIEPEEMRRLCALPQPTPGEPMIARDRALLLTLATTGMRASEIAAIRTEDVIQGRGGCLVTNILGKGQSEMRTAPLSKDAYDAIQDWLYLRPVHSPFVFSECRPDEEAVHILYTRKAMSYKGIYDVVKRWAKRGGMPTVKPHDFRRFVGTQVVKQRDIRTAQRVLGHASIHTTASYYVLDDVEEGVTDDLF